MHTKFLTADGRHLCFGSPNCDWKSMTEVKEIGIALMNCSSAANDLGKIFEIYWRIGLRQKGQRRILEPTHMVRLPTSLDTDYNSNNPMTVRSRDDPRKSLKMFFSVSPRLINTRYWIVNPLLRARRHF